MVCTGFVSTVMRIEELLSKIPRGETWFGVQGKIKLLITCYAD